MIQSRLKEKTHSKSLDEITKSFHHFMINGKVNAAIRLLSESENAGVLQLTNVTMQELHIKHPEAKPLNDDLLLQGPVKFLSPVIYDDLCDETILKSALHTKGAAGVSALDADEWRRIIGSNIYGNAAVDLRKSIANLARQLCSQEIKDPESIAPLMACRLIPLNKDPGVRPIGIGEVLRRIIGKAVVSILKDDILTTSGNLQLCSGQKSGCEIAIHAATEMFNDDENHGILQIDANNAFNSINRKVVLHNMTILCPEFAIYIRNCYATSARLFVTGGKELLSMEGTTQGDPIAMAMYAIGILPLLNVNTTTKRIAFADDFSGVGTLLQLKEWWLTINKHGPLIGYNPNASKSFLIVKPAYLEEAKQLFSDSEVIVTSEGHKHLGAVVGTTEYKNKFVNLKVNNWVKEITTLSHIAKVHPHVAYSAFVHGLQHRYTYIMRTVPDISVNLQPLENAIRQHLLPALLNGYVCDDIERRLFSLPAKLGGLSIFIPTKRCQIEYENSRRITAEMVTTVQKQDNEYNPDTTRNQNKIIAVLKKEKFEQNKQILEQIKINFQANQIRLRALEASLEIGASNWLTALPIKDHEFTLDKQSFWDALYLRYHIAHKNLPSKCVCGKSFTVDHALSCPRGGFTIIRHNEVRDFTANLLSQCYHDVKTEPSLLPLTGETFPASTITSDEARTDIAARGVWIKGQMAYFDVRVFNPTAKTYLKSDISSAHNINEREKKRSYNKRILRVDQGSFTPLVFTCFGGMSRECHTFFKRIAEKLADKKNINTSTSINWIRTRLNFHLIRSCLLCLRGSRSPWSSRCESDVDINLVSNESS